MGFKKENYTLKGICICVYFLLVTNTHSILGQSHCPIRVEYEPRQLAQSRYANTIEEIKFPFFQQWQDLNELRFSDDERANVVLPGVKRSTLFKGKNLGFSLPNSAQISGIELIVEGHTSGDGFAEGQMVRLLDSSGQAIGFNAANSALPTDMDWAKSEDNTDFVWRYGSPNDTWGISLSEDLIRSQEFGYALQVRNKLNAPVSVSIDHIQMIVYYTPLYEVCSTHACVPFYIDDSEDPLITYKWYIPQGFELISDSEEDPAINIGVSYAEFGEYEICVESFNDAVSQGICCRKFNYIDCEFALLSGHVFFDQNNDSSDNANDTGIAGIIINLFSGQGAFISSTVTDNNGDYVFPDLLSGQYYLEVINNIDSLVFTVPNIGLDSEDSDVTNFFGEGTTDLIELAPNQSITTVDVGFNLTLSIGNFVWEDLNGDGIQQTDEPGIEDVPVTVTSQHNNTYTTKTDENGFYSFVELQAGEYTIDFETLDGYTPTIPNNTDNEFDSDVVPDVSIILTNTEGGIVDSIDAGYYRPGTVGDFVWEDIDNNGLQDVGEPGINGVILSLINSDGISIQSTTSDAQGFYIFENISPGEYFIEILPGIRFTPTAFEVGVGMSDDINSDVFTQGDLFISSSFNITSNITDLSLDFGFVERPARLGGFTFIDQNNNGQYDSDEEFLPAINVLLFDSNNVQIDNTQSDIGGFYQFENIPAGSYYLVFELISGYLFTAANVEDDLSDSDVTSVFAEGSTDIFSLSPDEENFSISAGYQKRPKVGDFIWLDENRNGIQDPDEMGLNDVFIELFNDQNELQQSTTSGSNPESGAPGYYQFESLEPGSYYIKIPIEELFDFTIIDDTAIGLNSSITNENGLGTSFTFNLVGNQCNNDIDAGYAFNRGGIIGEVWVDENEDGIQDPTDILKSGILISLYTEDGTFVLSTTSGEEGQYSFVQLEARNYYIVFSPDDRYGFTSPMGSTDLSLDSDVTDEIVPGSTSLITVLDGTTIENIDAGLVDGAVTIEGAAWLDENADGIQQNTENLLPNINVELFDLDGSLLVTANTDANGFYSFDTILAGQYYIVFTAEDNSLINTFANQGTDDNIDDDVTSFFTQGSTDTIDIMFFQDQELINAGYYELSSIGNQVFIDNNENGINDNEPGLDNVIINLINESGAIVATDTTAQGGGLDSGYYLIENIPPGTYTVQFIRPLFYQFVAANQGGDDTIDSDVSGVSDNIGTTDVIEISSGTIDLTIDAGVFYQLPAESSISGIVWDDTNTNGIREANEPPIEAVSMQLENQDGDIIDITSSNSEGNYTFQNLIEGFYIVKATLPPNKTATFSNIGLDDTIDSDFTESSNELHTETFFLATFEDIENIDLGLINTLQIGDFVWEDANNNGIQDVGELGIEEIEITITSENGIISETVMSDINGAYQFTDLPAGIYKISVTLPSGFNFAKSNIGSDLLDSDVDSLGCTSFIDFTAGGIVNDLDIGFTKNGSIEGVAFVDLNGNGVNNMNDPGLDGVIVNLHSASGELLESVVTNSVNDISGIFRFTNLKVTDYYLVFEFPEEYIIADPDVGDDLTDSDITGLFGEGSTDLFAIPSGGIVNTVNGGAYLPASIGNEVWMDENEDGIRDADEQGVPNIEVIIFRSFGVPFDTTFTDDNGSYQFENLKQGLYFIQFMIPQEFTISPSDQGIDDNVDSDADNTGTTPLISLAHGADLESVDCGIFSSMASLRSVVWNDSNGDGMRQNQEARIPGIRVVLLDDLGNLIGSTETNSLGLYAFQEIREGEYKIFVNLENTDYAFTSMNMNDDDYHDSDIKASGESENFLSDTAQSALSVPNVDVGLYESGGIISIVWEDENADGLYDINEVPFSDIEASLFTKDGIYIRKIRSTEEEENIQFDNIPPGEYFIKYRINKNYVPSPIKGDKMDDNNSDVFNFEGYYITPTFQVLANEIVSYIDAGFYKGSEVITNIWFDTNINGLQDDQGEIPTGIYATIYNNEGKSFGTKGISQEGQIQFTGIPKGGYYIKYYSSSSLNFTKNLEETGLNSDVDHSNGMGTTRLFDFIPYESYTHIDAGLMKIKDIVHDLSTPLNTPEENNTRDQQINDEDKLFFEVYPNPATTYLKINVDRSISEGKISIRNNQNQLVFDGNVKDFDKINISEFHSGIYYVKYELNGKSIIRKILKIK